MEETEERHASCFFNYLPEGIFLSIFKYCVDQSIDGLQEDQPTTEDLNSKYGSHILKSRQMDSAKHTTNYSIGLVDENEEMATSTSSADKNY